MTNKTGNKRRFHSLGFKRKVVALTYVPGATVAEVARRHGLNDNMVFRWRRELRQACETHLEHPFLPVEITADPVAAQRGEVPPGPLSPEAMMEVCFADSRRLRLPLSLDDQTLRRLIRLVETA